MFDFKRLFKPKQPQQEEIPNHVYDFIKDVNRDYAETYIEFFCPWVKYNDLSEEDQKRFSKLAAITYGIAEGWIPNTFDPLDLDEFKDLIPTPTTEELGAYIESVLQPTGDDMAKFAAAVNPE